MTVGELVIILNETWKFDISRKDNKVIWIAQKNGMHFTSDWKGYDDYTDAIENFLEFALEVENGNLEEFMIYNTLL